MFILAGNEAELERLYGLIDHHKAEIAKGNMPVYVDGYCASLSTTKENLNTAFARANRVKSELITRKGLKEADFITANYARAYYNLSLIHISEPTRLGMISYAVFCLKKKRTGK